MTCAPCQQKAALSVGDAICRRIATHDSIDCHELIHKVILKQLTLSEYVEALEEKANEKEKGYLQEMKRTYG